MMNEKVGANLCVRPQMQMQMQMQMQTQKHNINQQYNLPQRKSIRLKGYDYAQRGLYFITICTQHHKYLLGEIEDNKMNLNDVGRMVEKWYYELENKFLDIKCNEMVIMPNHIHFIIKNIGDTNESGEHICEHTSGEHTGSPLRQIIQWWKTMTTNEYIYCVKNHGWKRFNKHVWQRNYYEHIIRNDEDYKRIAEYIINNPTNWHNDKLNMGQQND